MFIMAAVSEKLVLNVKKIILAHTNQHNRIHNNSYAAEVSTALSIHAE